MDRTQVAPIFISSICVNGNSWRPSKYCRADYRRAGVHGNVRATYRFYRAGHSHCYASSYADSYAFAYSYIYTYTYAYGRHHSYC